MMPVHIIGKTPIIENVGLLGGRFFSFCCTGLLALLLHINVFRFLLCSLSFRQKYKDPVNIFICAFVDLYILSLLFSKLYIARINKIIIKLQ